MTWWSYVPPLSAPNGKDLYLLVEWTYDTHNWTHWASPSDYVAELEDRPMPTTTIIDCIFYRHDSHLGSFTAHPSSSAFSQMQHHYDGFVRSAYVWDHDLEPWIQHHTIWRGSVSRPCLQDGMDYLEQTSNTFTCFHYNHARIREYGYDDAMDVSQDAILAHLIQLLDVRWGIHRKFFSKAFLSRSPRIRTISVLVSCQLWGSVYVITPCYVAKPLWGCVYQHEEMGTRHWYSAPFSQSSCSTRQSFSVTISCYCLMVTTLWASAPTTRHTVTHDSRAGCYDILATFYLGKAWINHASPFIGPGTLKESTFVGLRHLRSPVSSQRTSLCGSHSHCWCASSSWINASVPICWIIIVLSIIVGIHQTCTSTCSIWTSK